MYGKSNYRKDTPGTPGILQDRENLDRIAALGSFIFVRGGSLYEEAVRRGIDVKPL